MQVCSGPFQCSDPAYGRLAPSGFVFYTLCAADVQKDTTLDNNQGFGLRA